MNELQKAMETTKKYGDKFGGWTEEQIKNRLISGKKFKLPITNDKLLINENYLEKTKIAKEFTEKYLAKIEDILMVGVTGSVAAENPKAEDDVDLMVITKRDCLWITRIKIFVIFWSHKVPHRTNKDNICINLWLDEEALEIKKGKQNIRNAMDLILMKPILNRNFTYEKFVLVNKWAERYVVNGYRRLIANNKLRMTSAGTSYLKKIINWVMFIGQYCYMKKKMRKELVDLHRSFFHPSD